MLPNPTNKKGLIDETGQGPFGHLNLSLVDLPQHKGF